MTQNEQTAVAVIEPTVGLQVNLDGWPEERYNRLLPVQTLGLATDLIKPIVQAVVAKPAGTDGKSPDHYSSPDIPTGRRALTKRFLDALASAAGVDIVEERRLDNGSDPLKCGVQVRAEMLLPTGRRITTTGTKWVDMNRMPWSGGITGAQAAKFKSTIYEHTASRARNRAIRAILSLQQSYTVAELQKPFAVVSFVPNMDHPAIRERILDAMAPAIASVYGPASARQLGAGETTELPEVADDDEPTFREEPAAPAPAAAAAPAQVADDDDEPAWMRDAPAQVETAATSVETTQPDLATRIRDTAAAGGLKGAVKDPQLEGLKKVFAAIGGRATTAGLTALWPELTAEIIRTDPKALTANQAQAIINIARQHETDEAFADAWRAMAGIEAA